MNYVKAPSSSQASPLRSRPVSALARAGVCCALLTFVAADARAAQEPSPTPATRAGARAKPGAQKDAKRTAGAAAAGASADDEATLKAELDEIVKLPVAERVERLRAFVAARAPESASTLRARELLVGARAALGDERLGAGDGAGGVQFFNEAVEEFAPEMSDRLFDAVIAQLPANLFLRNHREAAFALARRIEGKVKENPRRLLGLASFYMGVEGGEDAARVAAEAVRLAPDAAPARQALGAALRLSLRLEDAAGEYARAVELDPRSTPARRGLADLRRATGNSEEAATLYRELLAANAKDAGARAGLVLSLFESGKREEAERELKDALAAQPDNLPLLVGASYWFSSQGEGKRALELAERAVKLEPRYRWVWARVALARALLVERRPLEAEGVLRLARTLGRFPTLDYELASALAAAGLYEEAAEELSQTFTLRDGQIETLLAGRQEARAADFDTLLAPERRASTFFYTAADTPENARQLKALLAFRQATARKGPGERLSEAEERETVAAATEFGAGEDEMRAFRRLYAAGQLLQRGAALQTVVEATDAAMLGVEPALDAPSSTAALLADELRELRSRARGAGAQGVSVPEVAREVRSKVLRGRIEDMAGWALYNQGKYAEAVVRLRRAVGVLPAESIWWRGAQWHLGAALDAEGKQTEALAAYVTAYRLAPDPARRAVIEVLYRKVRGTNEGLDRLLSAPAVASAPTQTADPLAAVRQAARSAPKGATQQELAAVGARAAANTPPAPEVAPTPTSEVAPTPTPTPEVAPTPTPETEPTPTPEVAATPEAVATPTPEALATPTPEAVATPTPDATPSPTPEEKAAESEKREEVAQTRAEVKEERAGEKDSAGAARVSGSHRVGGAGGACAATLSETAVRLKAGGGSAVVSVQLEGVADLTKIRPATPNWADIVILAEPRTDADAENARRFTISSVSGKPGLYNVTFNTPCGKQEVAVTVQ